MISGAVFASNLGEKMEIKDQIVKKLGLEPLPGEGGLYKETYRSKLTVDASKLGIAGSGPRQVSTAIYYMVTENNFSALHRVKSDEIFHFYLGDPVEMVQIMDDGKLQRIIMGPDILAGQSVQVVVPAGIWQGTRLMKGGKWALFGTTVAPGFDFSDFELADRKHLTKEFPTHVETITRYTYE
jgi:predicted cupin superfamily sugar epimerase